MNAEGPGATVSEHVGTARAGWPDMHRRRPQVADKAYLGVHMGRHVIHRHTASEHQGRHRVCGHQGRHRAGLHKEEQHQVQEERRRAARRRLHMTAQHSMECKTKVDPGSS